MSQFTISERNQCYKGRAPAHPLGTVQSMDYRKQVLDLISKTLDLVLPFLNKWILDYILFLLYSGQIYY